MGGTCAKKTTVDHTDVVLEQAADGADALPSAARAALRAAVKAHRIPPGTPQQQGLALAKKALWAETWDGGVSWHAAGRKKKRLVLSPEEAAAERKVKAVVEEEDYAAYSTIEPDSEASAIASHARGVTIEFLINWTNENDCWDMPTWQVVRDIIKPATVGTRCRYADLPEVRATGAVGPADTFASHCWGSKFGLLVSALADQADPQRRVWLWMCSPFGNGQATRRWAARLFRTRGRAF